MSDDPSSGRQVVGREQANLEDAHHEICTALTVLRSNVELVRIELRGEPLDAHTIAVHGHLSELELAVERLQRLAATMRGWHASRERPTADP